MADSLVPGIDEELVRVLKEPAGSNLRGADAEHRETSPRCWRQCQRLELMWTSNVRRTAFMRLTYSIDTDFISSSKTEVRAKPWHRSVHLWQSPVWCGDFAFLEV